ncbi:GDSL-type esterase/lipase family protein [Paenibacillus gallinarum]|uniref:Lysophospholipase n=1 Tax=Paenibacillus gallinarum TaxID=2762232 RepID=A0ABR8SUG1_9BACL|nr:GDSL-type esterase/lipase family protein [Paenibacillus gallinarum]MBD7967141.1 lysophospholipase [Paenibacillus gallinarum]
MVYRYLALGDSLTVGIGALFGSGFVPLYQKRLEYHLHSAVLVSNQGINGLTSQRLLSMVKYNQYLRNLIVHADIITISIGGNDLIQAARSTRWNLSSPLFIQTLDVCEHNMKEMLSQIHSLKKESENYFIRLVGLYNPLPKNEAAYHWVKQYNDFLTSLDSNKIATAQLLYAFQGRERELLFFDKVHPSSKGYRVIESQLDRIGYAPLLQLEKPHTLRKKKK